MWHFHIQAKIQEVSVLFWKKSGVKLIIKFLLNLLPKERILNKKIHIVILYLFINIVQCNVKCPASKDWNTP